MQKNLLLKFLSDYAEYCQQNDITGTVAFHGGEPLLMGKSYFSEILNHEAFFNRTLHPSLQTNGTLIDGEWASLFAHHNVTVGVSLDGPQSLNDAFRITGNGSGSYTSVVRGINHLRSAGVDPTVLCVVNPSADGQQVFEHFVDLGIRKLDFLPPITNHAQQRLTPIDLVGVQKFLVDVFFAWIEKSDPLIEIRLFKEMIARYFRDSGGYSPIGMKDWNNFAVLEVDGFFARSEELFETELLDGARRYKTDANIMTDSFTTIVEKLNLRFAHIDHQTLPTQCNSCPMNDVCLGGNIATRFDEQSSFDNPGVHCSTLYKISNLIKRCFKNTEFSRNHTLETSHA